MSAGQMNIYSSAEGVVIAKGFDRVFDSVTRVQYINIECPGNMGLPESAFDFLE